MVGPLLAAVLAVAPRSQEGDAQAFTSLIDVATGAAIADGRYSQQVSGGVLRIEARYDFPDGRTIVERATLRLSPRLEQEGWDWTERRGSDVIRQYEVDFRSRHAVATRVDQQKRWKEDLDIHPGKTFAGIAFVAVIKQLRSELAPGQKVELEAVAMTPKPRTAGVEITRAGVEDVRMAGRKLAGDHYVIHPQVPAIAKLLVNAPDQHVWLFGEGPPAFLRYQGPLVEPGDPAVRVDLIPSRSANVGRTPPRRR